MVKLTKFELSRIAITESMYINDGDSLQEVIDKGIVNGYFSFEYDYSDVSVRLVWDRLETDDEYNSRIDKLEKAKQKAADVKRAKKKQTDEEELKLYEKLKAKFEKSN